MTETTGTWHVCNSERKGKYLVFIIIAISLSTMARACMVVQVVALGTVRETSSM